MSEQLVWVVISDYGLNGSEIRAVLSYDPKWSNDEIERRYGGTWTGYSGTEVVKIEVVNE